jgi:hypothetical protein
MLKTERCEASRPNRESGDGKLPSDETEIIVAHVDIGAKRLPFKRLSTFITQRFSHFRGA